MLPRIKNAFLAMLAFILAIIATYTVPESYSDADRIKAASSSFAKEIAQISSTFVYSFDKKQLRHSLSVILAGNKSIRAIKITDAFTKEQFFSYYHDEAGAHYDRAIPHELTSFVHSGANISFGGELLGKLDLYYKEHTVADKFGNISNDFGYRLRLLAVFFVILLFMLYVIFHTLSVKSVSDTNPLAFGSNRFAIIVMVAMSIFVTFSIAGGWFILDQSENNVKSRLKGSLVQTLNAIEINIDKINQIRVGVSNHITQKAEFQDVLRKLIEAKRVKDEEALSKYRKKAILFLNRYELFGRSESRVIVDTNGEIILSTSDLFDNVTIDKSTNSPFINAIAGEASLLPPIRGGLAKEYKHVFIAVPIFDLAGRVIAVSTMK